MSRTLNPFPKEFLDPSWHHLDLYIERITGKVFQKKDGKLFVSCGGVFVGEGLTFSPNWKEVDDDPTTKEG